ncbi:hypothetical protein AX16_002353 [Volvariella volvacea WC 439]|nr:hypothetical protein AX16_002353 [Volvariella volvacea WC 439]
MFGRRKSPDSSESSGSEDEHSGFKIKKDKKDKKDKKEKKDKKDKDKGEKKEDKDKAEKKDKKEKEKEKDKDKDKKSKDVPSSSSHHSGGGTAVGHGSTGGGSAQEFYSSFDQPSSTTTTKQIPATSSGAPSFPAHGFPAATATHPPAPGPTPAPHTMGRAPPSGFRIPLSGSNAQIPPPQELGPPPCYEPDGTTPVYIGSALLDNSVHPCKIAFHFSPPARVPYGTTELEHHGRYDLLPFVPQEMEFVMTGWGRIPEGRRPVEGGYEETGEKLYHAVAYISGVRVPGKTGEHLGGCNIGFAGSEHVIQENYEILCWK